jgi:hypothetical protein
MAKLKKILSFREWVAKEERSSVEFANKFITGLAKEDRHEGDCTQDPCPCGLCQLERILKEYHKYCENQGQFKII